MPRQPGWTQCISPPFTTGPTSNVYAGIGDAYIVLLEEVGVCSAKDLAAIEPEVLRDRLNKVNEEKKLVGRIPAPAMVNGWVKRAQYLTRPSH